MVAVGYPERTTLYRIIPIFLPSCDWFVGYTYRFCRGPEWNHYPFLVIPTGAKRSGGTCGFTGLS
jgi:hypothetical protein